MTRRLIVNADDFGRSPGITRGILQAHREGVVSSTTLMVNLPWSSEAGQLSRAEPDLGLGLHLSFCYGPALSPKVGSLLGADGRLERNLGALRARARPEDVERECRAQLACFESLTGRMPTHLDSHQHVHTWPNVWRVVADVACEHGLPVRASTPEHVAMLRSVGVACPDAFIVTFFGAGRIDVASLSALLRTLPEGTTELMCHPGFDDEAAMDSSYRAEREMELRTLCSAEIRDVIEEQGIELVSFRSIV